MSDPADLSDPSRWSRRAVESLATGLSAQIAAMTPSELQISLLGYVLCTVVADRARRVGLVEVVHELEAYLAESIATGLDVGTEKAGHGVRVRILTPSRVVIPE